MVQCLFKVSEKKVTFAAWHYIKAPPCVIYDYSIMPNSSDGTNFNVMYAFTVSVFVAGVASLSLNTMKKPQFLILHIWALKKIQCVRFHHNFN